MPAPETVTYAGEHLPAIPGKTFETAYKAAVKVYEAEQREGALYNEK